MRMTLPLYTSLRLQKVTTLPQALMSGRPGSLDPACWCLSVEQGSKWNLLESGVIGFEHATFEGTRYVPVVQAALWSAVALSRLLPCPLCAMRLAAQRFLIRGPG